MNESTMWGGGQHGSRETLQFNVLYGEKFTSGMTFRFRIHLFNCANQEFQYLLLTEKSEKLLTSLNLILFF